MRAIYPSQESVSGILNAPAAKWDANEPVLRLINSIYVQVQARRWPRRQAQGGTNSSAQMPARAARVGASSGTYLVE